jgi:hypothetical protein
MILTLIIEWLKLGNYEFSEYKQKLRKMDGNREKEKFMQWLYNQDFIILKKVDCESLKDDED